ncbi:MAG: phosphatase PAP2 family protein [Candidatus Cloacimonas sp.]|nr:phosphatase PAP2 family protein [Candidatus Cloacimonas sp.]
MLAEQYKKTKWVPPTVYTIAVLTSLSRLNDDQHWTSDVFAGAVIGYVTAKLVLKDTPRLMLKVTPEINGVSLMYNF